VIRGRGREFHSVGRTRSRHILMPGKLKVKRRDCEILYDRDDFGTHLLVDPSRSHRELGSLLWEFSKHRRLAPKIQRIQRLEHYIYDRKLTVWGII